MTAAIRRQVVVRSSSDIGTHRVRVQPSGDETGGDVGTDIQVKVSAAG